MPGFVWENPVSIALGAVYLGVMAAIGGCYIAWMHNASLTVGE
jgi:hypothetical protein